MIRFKIQDFDRWLRSKQPHRIFHDSEMEWYNYSDGRRVEGDLFGISTNSGDFYTNYEYTKLGKFMNKLPIIPDLFIKGVYYIVTWPLYLVVKIPWMLFCVVFVPSGWL